LRKWAFPAPKFARKVPTRGRVCEPHACMLMAAALVDVVRMRMVSVLRILLQLQDAFPAFVDSPSEAAPTVQPELDLAAESATSLASVGSDLSVAP
jgi:hypothetical protein